MMRMMIGAALSPVGEQKVAVVIVVDVILGVAEFELLLAVAPLLGDGGEGKYWGGLRESHWELVEVVRWVLACVVVEVGSVVVVLVWETMEGQD